eukprot:3293557-Pyramimonas_sp.AAC.1
MSAGRRRYGDDRSLPQEGGMTTASSPCSLQGAPVASKATRAYQHLSMPTARKPGEGSVC